MTVKDKVKKLLFINDEPTVKQDQLLDTIIELTQDKLKLRYPDRIIPTELEFIVVEVSIARFNRIGSEGMKSESVEGHSISFNDDDFKDYEKYILDYLEELGEIEARKVYFL